MATEKRLIDANALTSEFEWLKSVVNESSKDEIQDVIQRIKNAPTVDAVEIPDCKKCVFNYTIAWHQCENCIGEARNNFVEVTEVKQNVENG